MLLVELVCMVADPALLLGFGDPQVLPLGLGLATDLLAQLLHRPDVTEVNLAEHAVLLLDRAGGAQVQPASRGVEQAEPLGDLLPQKLSSMHSVSKVLQ